MTINERVEAQLEAFPESKSWSSKRWAEFLGCSKSSIQKAAAWRRCEYFNGGEPDYVPTPEEIEAACERVLRERANHLHHNAEAPQPYVPRVRTLRLANGKKM